MGARCGSTITSHALSFRFSFRYPVGAMDGRSPCSHRVRSPRFTFSLLLSFSSFAVEHRIMSMNFSLGLFVNFCEKVRISMSCFSSIRSTSAPRSPAFLLRRSGAHVRMPLNLPLLMSLSNSLKTSRCPPYSFLRTDSKRPLWEAADWLGSPVPPTPWLGLSSRQWMTQPLLRVQSVLVGSQKSLQGDEKAKKARFAL